ncbi:MAG: type II toxin-antitoxin system RelE/ParE family toxin [Anaerolineaceae bacterium]|nr:type II toxin-antitoxin system RelE/ParE family toxin [Anaerolineaceae bacterium]
MYTIKLHNTAVKQLKRIPLKDRRRLIDTIYSLKDSPRTGQTVHLDDILYRIRVGNYRIIYAVLDNEMVVLVVKAARRSESTYRNLRALITRAYNLLEE